MDNKNSFIAWLQENLQRLFAKSPQFFKIWNIINGLLALIAGVPTMLVAFDIVLPPDQKWVGILMKAVAAAGAWGWFMGKLTVQRPAMNEAGEMVGPEKETKLPFTEKVEAKQTPRS